VPVAKAVTGKSQLITRGISRLSPGASWQRTARAALAGSASPLLRLSLLLGIEPSRAKGAQISLPSPLGFQRLQRSTSGMQPADPARFSPVAMHHWPWPSPMGAERWPSKRMPLRPAWSSHRLLWPAVAPTAGT